LPFYDLGNEKGQILTSCRIIFIPRGGKVTRKREKLHAGRPVKLSSQQQKKQRKELFRSLLWRRDKFDQLPWYSLSKKRE